MQANKRLKIIIISDGTGETATALCRAVMTQFKEKDAYFTRYKNVRTIQQIEAIFTEAAIHHDLIIYTMVDTQLREEISACARSNHVRALDLGEFPEQRSAQSDFRRRIFVVFGGPIEMRLSPTDKPSHKV